jgi:hypothetical protein
MGVKTLEKGSTVIIMSDNSFVNEGKWRWDRCMYTDFVYKRRKKTLERQRKRTTVERLYLFIYIYILQLQNTTVFPRARYTCGWTRCPIRLQTTTTLNYVKKLYRL